MIKKTWYDHFLDVLTEKYPKKADLAHALMDLLHIEREATYRRLRKDVMFPMHEIVQIAAEWNISLDEIIGVKSQKVLFQMHPLNYLEPSKEDLNFLRQRIRVIEQLRDYPNSEYVVACNNLSRSLVAGFEILYKFLIFSWAYEYYTDYSKTFAEIKIPEEIRKVVKSFHRTIKYVATTSFILDNRLFENVIHQIEFFHSIFLITKEEKELLKKDLHALVDYLFEVATTGCFPETKNKVHIYISMFKINTNYSYFNYGHKEACLVHAFNMYDIITNNSEMIKNFKIWMQKKKRTAIQISEVDERTRIEYFTKLRKLVDSL